jgi:hypothetical protein
VRGLDQRRRSPGARTYLTAAREKSGYRCAVWAYATYRLPALSIAAGSNDAETVLSPASAARLSVHEPGDPSFERATQTRVSPTTLASGVPNTDAPQPPAADVRVPQTAYTAPLRRFTTRLDGAPESEHWRSR